jgi:hypothetical protein
MHSPLLVTTETQKGSNHTLAAQLLQICLGTCIKSSLVGGILATGTRHGTVVENKEIEWPCHILSITTHHMRTR